MKQYLNGYAKFIMETNREPGLCNIILERSGG